jgi:cytochrome c5
MSLRPSHALVALALLVASGAAPAQQKRAAVGFPDAPGKDVLVSKCFQCHAPTMWMDLRQDRRAWESTLYRMVGRGALWTEDDIRQMADYLGSTYGLQTSGRKQ